MENGKQTILVTGANGFVGNGIISYLSQHSNHILRASVRNDVIDYPAGVTIFPNCDIASSAHWAAALSGADCVIHCAARVHIMQDTSHDPLADFREINVTWTLNLAREAAKQGVKRFIFLSSIAVNGIETFGTPFTAEDDADPTSFYAQSKYEAEIGLRKIAQETGLEVVIIRPPLVYGPNAPGNFGMMLRMLKRRLPLPFGGIDNKKTLVALDNLSDLISLCITHPKAANETFLVSDDEDISTTDLMYHAGLALGHKPLLLWIPACFLQLAACIVGNPLLSQRLLGSLQIDITKTREILGWRPPVKLSDALKHAAALTSFSKKYTEN